MSHVDEGTIHAWLDGALAPDDPEGAAFEAHIRDCAQCRERVEAERRVRDRASAVLEQVRPDNVRVEPFEKILAARRAATEHPAATGEADPAGVGDAPEADAGPGEVVGSGSGSDAARVEAAPDITRRRSFRIPMAIAATLVLAVTATWMARRITGSHAQSQPAMEADAASAPAPEGASMNRVAPAAQNAPPTISAVPSEQKMTAEVETAAARPVTASELQSAQRGQRPLAKAQEPPPVVGIVEPPQRSRAETRRIDSLARVTAAAAEAGRNEQVAEEAVAQSGALTDSINDRFGARVLAWAVDWQPVDLAAAARRLGRPPPFIDDLPIDSLAVGEVEGRAVVRVVQTATSGQRIELIQWAPLPASAAGALETRRAAAAAVPPEAAMASRDEADVLPSYRTSVPGVVVLIRALLPADSLAALARRIHQ